MVVTLVKIVAISHCEWYFFRFIHISLFVRGFVCPSVYPSVPPSILPFVRGSVCNAFPIYWGNRDLRTKEHQGTYIISFIHSFLHSWNPLIVLWMDVLAVARGYNDHIHAAHFTWWFYLRFLNIIQDVTNYFITPKMSPPSLLFFHEWYCYYTRNKYWFVFTYWAVDNFSLIQNWTKYLVPNRKMGKQNQSRFM